MRGKDNPIRYRRYYYDTETGLYYLQSRYYDPDTGRFINADDVAFLGATGTALSCNLFAYCENNPAILFDESGYLASNIIGAIVGGVIGAVGGYILARHLANMLNLTGWKKTVFIAGVTALVGATVAVLGYFLSPYIAKIWTMVSAKLICVLKGAYKGFKFVAKHMMNPKHAWSLVLGNNVTETAARGLVVKVITKGTWTFLSNGAIEITWQYKGQIIKVTGAIVNFLFTISNAWVVTK